MKKWKEKVLKFVCKGLKVPYHEFEPKVVPKEWLAQELRVNVVETRMPVMHLKASVMIDKEMLFYMRDPEVQQYTERLRKLVEQDSFLSSGKPVRVPFPPPEYIQTILIRQLIENVGDNFDSYFDVYVDDPNPYDNGDRGMRPPHYGGNGKSGKLTLSIELHAAVHKR